MRRWPWLALPAATAVSAGKVFHVVTAQAAVAKVVVALLAIIALAATLPADRALAQAGAPTGLLDRDDRLDVPLFEGPHDDARFPSPDRFLGYPLGARFTAQPRVVDYLRALANAAPDRALWESYGETYEGRVLGTLTIASAANRARLEAIRADMNRLADPTVTDEAAARELARRLPVVVWLSYNVHGNEASPSEAAMAAAYEILAGRDAAALLDSAIVILDPCINPDGHDRYVNWINGVQGRLPDANPDSREHDEPWPGGRYNHYLFDLNRDWAWQTQAETRQRVAAYLRWRPQVHVDFHEMYYNSTYFFFPPARPVNGNLPAQVERWFEVFGQGNAAAFDARGWRFYKGEEFDLYYPGYGDSWPTFQGATGMTYEMAGHSRGGTMINRRDGTTLTLRERVRKHLMTSLATLRTARENRARRLLDYYDFFADGVRGRLQGPATYLVPPGNDPTRSAEMVNLLLASGARVEQAEEPLKVSDLRDDAGERVRRDLPAGTYVIPMRQPMRALVNALLEPEAALPETLFYDITAWSLPTAYGVETLWTDAAPQGRTTPLTRVRPPLGGLDGDSARVAWILPWDSNGAPKALGRLLNMGMRASFATRPIEVDGTIYARGTIVVPVETNGDSLGARLARIGRESGVLFHAAASGWSGAGVDLGSDRVVPLKTPRIAVVTGDGVDPTSFGAIWFLLDRQYEIPASALPLSNLSTEALAGYNVLVFPDDESGRGQSYAARLDSNAVVRLRRWVEGGGTLVGLAGGAAWATQAHAGLSAVKLKPADDDTTLDKSAREADALKRKLATLDDREVEERRESVPGTILRVKLDPSHPLSYGYHTASDVGSAGAEARILKTQDTVFDLSESVHNVGWYPENPRVSGYLSEKNETRLVHTAFLTEESLGRGHIVLYNADPNFRLFWYGLNRLFLNSLFFTGSL